MSVLRVRHFVLSLFIYLTFCVEVFSEAPVFQTPRRSKSLAAAGKFNIWMYLGFGVFIAIFLISLYIILKEKVSHWGPSSFKKDETKSKRSKKVRRPFQTQDSIDNPEPSQSISGTTKIGLQPSIDVTVSEKVRSQISDLVSGIRSIPTNADIDEAEPTVQDVKAELEALQDSEIVKGLAETMVSEPKVEPSDLGKFSKMSIDAVLLFDEEDLKTGASGGREGAQ